VEGGEIQSSFAIRRLKTDMFTMDSNYGRSVGFFCTVLPVLRESCSLYDLYRGADKSSPRQGRKQARKHVRDARYFDNIETWTVIKFFFFYLQCTTPKEIHAILTDIILCLSLVGLRTYRRACGSICKWMRQKEFTGGRVLREHSSLRPSQDSARIILDNRHVLTSYGTVH